MTQYILESVILELNSLNVYAFYLQPAYEVLSVQNSGANYAIEPFCMRPACQNWRIATIIFTAIRTIIIGKGCYLECVLRMYW